MYEKQNNKKRNSDMKKGNIFNLNIFTHLDCLKSEFERIRLP